MHNTVVLHLLCWTGAQIPWVHNLGWFYAFIHVTPCMSTHTAGGGKKHILHVHTAGGRELVGTHPARPFCCARIHRHSFPKTRVKRTFSSIENVCFELARENWVYKFGTDGRKVYTLTASDGNRYTLQTCTSILLRGKRDTPCTSILLVVERDTPCTSTRPYC